jgi:hypothetical protein
MSSVNTMQLNMGVKMVNPTTFLVLKKVNEDSHETIPQTLVSGSNSAGMGSRRGAGMADEAVAKLARPVGNPLPPEDQGVVYLPSIVPRKSQQSKFRKKN